MNWKTWYRNQIGRLGTLIIIAILTIIAIMLYYIFVADASTGATPGLNSSLAAPAYIAQSFFILTFLIN